MLSIKFEIDGKEVAPGDIKNALESSILKSVSANIESKIGQIRCTEHGEVPRVTVAGADLKSLKFRIAGCCEGLTRQVGEAFKP